MTDKSLGGRAEMSVVKLMENGEAVEFYVAKHNYESGLNGEGRTLLVRKDCYDVRAWHNSDVNAYAVSDMDVWLNSTYKNLLDVGIRVDMGATKFYYTPGNGNATKTTLERAVFLLSATELGRAHEYLNIEGTALEEASTLQVSYQDGHATVQWTRSSYTNGNTGVWTLSSTGGLNLGNASGSASVRPAFTLPASLAVGDDGAIVAGETAANEKLGTRAVGSIVKLEVNGELRDFIVVQQGKPSSLYDNSCVGTWLLMKDIYGTRKWNSSRVNDYAASGTHAYLNGEFLSLVDANIRPYIKQVKIPYCSGTGQTVNDGEDGLLCKIFLASIREVGCTRDNIPSEGVTDDGAKLDYFEDGNGTAEKVAYRNGASEVWWLRSPSNIYTGNVWCMNTGGSVYDNYCDNSAGIRPMLILPGSLSVSEDGRVIPNAAPAAPGGIRVPGPAGVGGVTVLWDGSENAAGYCLERRMDEGGWAEVYRGGLTRYADSASGWSRLDYRVRAYDSAGTYSGWTELSLRAGDFTAMISTGEDVIYLPETGEWEITISKDGDTAVETAACAEYGEYESQPAFAHVYGVSWDGTATTKWSRTDDAADFTDPVPYVEGASAYGSPFDNRWPWAGMVKSERAGGTMVAIPKFWYSLTQNGSGMDIRIADKPLEGFHTSPAHMDRGDGKGERDVVYIGRYLSGGNLKSTSGVAPRTGTARPDARSGVKSLGACIWLMDFATLFTIWLLYLVEFADWNSQKVIGIGRGATATSLSPTGNTDSMPYHTGAAGVTHATTGVGTQYRWIEDIWGSASNWCDGCYTNSHGLNIILNPESFSDNSGGASAGVPTNGCPSAFTVTSSGGFPMFIPSGAAGSDITYSCDIWNFYTDEPCVYIGGSYSSGGLTGMFSVNGTGINGSGLVSPRIQELPDNETEGT